MELSASRGSSDIEEYGVEMCAWLCLRRRARLDINPEVPRYGEVRNGSGILYPCTQFRFSCGCWLGQQSLSPQRPPTLKKEDEAH